MKALSLSQPWATLVVLGRKRLETRSWQTRHRGLLLIHAAQTFSAQNRAFCRRDPVRRLLAEAGIEHEGALPRGQLLGTVEVRDCRRSEEMDPETLDETERLLGDFGPGRWVWLLENAAPLQTPVPLLGRLGVFHVPDLE
jgi:hypothetical protein